MNDEVQHFVDELGFSEWVVAIGCKLLILMESFHQHGKWHVWIPWLHEFLFGFGDHVGVDLSEKFQ